MLQCRRGKRASVAAVAIACAFVDEGLVSIPEAIMMVTPTHLAQMLRPQFVGNAQYTGSIIGYGVGTAPGAAVGKITFGAGARSGTGHEEDLQGYILVKNETCSKVRSGLRLFTALWMTGTSRKRASRSAASEPSNACAASEPSNAARRGSCWSLRHRCRELVWDLHVQRARGVSVEHESRQVWGVLQDVKGMYAASGVLTQAGGLTSHAGAVARELGKPCVTACTGLVVHADKKTAELNGLQLSEGDTISINGTSGEVMLGPVKLSPPKLKGKLLRFMSWVEQYCGHLRPMALVNSPQEAQLVRPLPA